MLIDALAQVLQKSGCLDSFWGKLDSFEDAVLGVVSSARPFLVAARFAHKPTSTLIVVPGDEAAASYARTIASYIGEDKVFVFPERKDHPQLEEKADPKVIAKRLEAASVLAEGEKKVVVASARSLLRDLPPREARVYMPLHLVCNDELQAMGNEGVQDFDALKHALEAFGYVNTGELDGIGTFCAHGGTIDIFPGNLDFPIRLDFFGDELEDIRRIVATTGQMISSLPSVDIFPVTEIPITAKATRQAQKAIEKGALTNKTLRSLLEKLEGGLRFDGADVLLSYFYTKTASLGDYTSSDSLVCLVEPRAIFDDMTHAYDELAEKFKGTYLSVDSLYTAPAKTNFGGRVRATYASIMQLGIEVDDELPVKRVDVAGSPDRLFGKMRNWIDGGYTCIFSAPAHRLRQEVELDFVDHGLPIQRRLDTFDTEDAHLKKGVVTIVDVEIPLGIVIPKAKLVMASMEDTKGSKGATTRNKREINVADITFPYTAGDYVVHEVYGIAHFKGLVLREIDGTERDYLELDYAEGDKLFLPVEQFDKVTRYVGPEGSKPRITRLNSTDWSRAITKARKATKKLAFDLVDVYARRAATKGFRFEVDTPWLQEVEESFPYDETPDQAAAIEDVKADMHSAHPMDRLICGDVGFGKTEVALRAAFVAAQNKKQVMVLCPTTILTQQHYITFKERLAPFGMRVEVLSRFRSAAEQKQVLDAFAKGDVDVLIGTHRLLSRDVNPKNLGLVIIDEEQRFGVAHKEQFKNLRECIDILTLSATPIPRTMQMAVSGVRDMSLIMTPPDKRLPVKVHVGEWDPDIVSGAIRNELARGGQVYYVSNRVRTIDEAVERVRDVAPEARIGVAHGQMSKDELERVMEDFAAGLADVLVATTIIESGIDNPHTNTLIIEDSQRLGLSQMYQLKGRVGRSSEQAYAYFLFPEQIPLTVEAQSRLTALSENQDLGSGMRIALKDLEIRGAGNILGAEQSGNMSAVGFDLFAQLLNQAVIEVREGEEVAKSTRPISQSDINVNIPGHMYISPDYLLDIGERINWYRRVANASSVQEVDELQHELAATYPDMPQEAKNYFAREKLRAFASEHGISSITIVAGNLNIEGMQLSRSQLIPLKRLGGRYLTDKKKLILPTRKLKEISLDDEDNIAHQIMAFLEKLYNESQTDEEE